MSDYRKPLDRARLGPVALYVLGRLSGAGSNLTPPPASS